MSSGGGWITRSSTDFMKESKMQSGMMASGRLPQGRALVIEVKATDAYCTNLDVILHPSPLFK
jgi:hypothetical protein